MTILSNNFGNGNLTYSGNNSFHGTQSIDNQNDTAINDASGGASISVGTRTLSNSGGPVISWANGNQSIFGVWNFTNMFQHIADTSTATTVLITNLVNTASNGAVNYFQSQLITPQNVLLNSSGRALTLNQPS